MQILVPMAGVGERFKKAGYLRPKPLIVVDGQPMIQHVADMFDPDRDEFVFICNSHDLASTNLRQVLQGVASNTLVIEVPYDGKGPVHSTMAALMKHDAIDDNKPVTVCYCDFSVWWDYEDFKKKASQYDGAIPSYKGFHPHSLGNTYYGYIKLGGDGLFEQLREKESFTDNRMNEFAAAGDYYFRNGALMKKYFQKQLDLNLQKNGESYASLCYNLMHADGLKTFVYELEHFLQWGTPDDLAEYNYWSERFRRYVKIGPY